MRDGPSRRVALALAGALLALGAVVGIVGLRAPVVHRASPDTGAMAPPTVAIDTAVAPARLRPPVDHTAGERGLRLEGPLVAALLAAILGVAAGLRLGRADVDDRRSAGPSFRPHAAPRAPPSSPLAA